MLIFEAVVSAAYVCAHSISCAYAYDFIHLWALVYILSHISNLIISNENQTYKYKINKKKVTHFYFA